MSRAALIRAGCALLAGLAASVAAAGEAVREGVLRVGTSADYAPFSGPPRDPDGPPAGFDLALARAYAADRGLALELVRFRWPELLPDLAAGRFDVAMSGVTVRPERSVAGRFTVPVAESGAVALVRDVRFRRVQDLDDPSVRVAVNRGGHLERVTRARLPRAAVVPLIPNAAVREALLAGSAHAAISDTLEARQWLRGTRGVRLLGPFTRDRKAYLLPPNRRALAADLDAWLLAREADGSLQELRRLWLGEQAATPTATPLAALLAALDERLDLMIAVAEAKRVAGAAVEAPAREARVLDAAVAASREAASEAGRPEPDGEAVRALFLAQIRAAKEIQRRILAGPPGPDFENPPDLETELRPALLRIGERIALLCVRLPPGTRELELRAAVDAALRDHALTEATRAALAAALARLAPRLPPLGRDEAARYARVEGTPPWPPPTTSGSPHKTARSCCSKVPAPTCTCRRWRSSRPAPWPGRGKAWTSSGCGTTSSRVCTRSRAIASDWRSRRSSATRSG